MADTVRQTTAKILNAGMKSMVSDIEVGCEKIKALEDNNELHDQMQNTIKFLTDDRENIDFATKISNMEESVKNEQSFYLDKTGFSASSLQKNKRFECLETAAKILQQTGIDDYKSNSLFMKYMEMIEKCNKQKELIDDIDEHIDKLKKVIELQNDLKSELSNIVPPSTSNPMNIESNEDVEPIKNLKEIVEIVKKIADIDKKQTDVCTETSKLKAHQKKTYHGLPPTMNEAIKAVQLAEQHMKSITKKLIEKLAS